MYLYNHVGIPRPPLVQDKNALSFGTQVKYKEKVTAITFFGQKLEFSWGLFGYVGCREIKNKDSLNT